MPRQFLAEYPDDSARFDEMFSAPGVPRAHYAALYQRLLGQTAPQLRELFNDTDRQIRDNGVTYNVYDDEEGSGRPWAMDPLPLIIPAAEWAGIERGVQQRARLFNSILADLYGPQQLFHEGRLPPALVLGHPGFQRPAHGIQPPGGVFLHILAVDLARSPDGQWWVVNDRSQSPSGMGYALENRIITARLLPELFRELRVTRLASFFAALRDSIASYAPHDNGLVNTVVLTPGPYNETYFEHAYLARYLGFPLVEGQDLTVRDGCVWLKTLSGLRRVHAIIRRMDDDFCDPLELRADSALGVPGLMDVVRRGNVLLANGIGASVIETGALAGFLPGLSQHLLGEELAMPGVATWWCGETLAMEDALEKVDHLVFKSAVPHPQGRRIEPVFGEDLDEDGRARLAARVRANPRDYYAQELVSISRAPLLDRSHGRKLLARPVGLRVFAVATPEGYMVMPGGLARSASGHDARILSNQRGGGSKDVWVCGETAGAPISLLRRPVEAADLVRSGAGLSSRVVENLFWFGRYSERCDNLARYLRVALTRVTDNVDNPGEWKALAALGKSIGVLPADCKESEAVRPLLRATFDSQHHGGLASHILHLSRTGFQLRERLSSDNWRTLNALAQKIGTKPHERVGIFEALAQIDEYITSFMTLAGFALDGMTRDHGWRFLSLGRRIERLQFQTEAIEAAMKMGVKGNPEWLLEVSDSIVTYRSRYMARPEWIAVLDLLIADDTNPRGIVFQTAGLCDYVERLNASLGDMPDSGLDALHRRLLALDPGLDFHPGSRALGEAMVTLRAASASLSDQISQHYFSHAEEQARVIA
ncbi:circularly permuted type 2 ATP-grasp protein [Uliginosibacterium aquaticum]|uniref:Circularly permuted type 2 ATP-grasp protein n=1 Tax=Uliginosibacterium aquaticum TaxID=2731212 RepID=A0ABX2IBR5_9RHOO|nr:circularly permuted type 2 ATP-grasp protein [Uliginosibacterium aquaticum]NSL53899.1 circularly permuted type 2 ATP-grasp protein [Uliginosibacterium aquaticum]